MRKPMYNEKRVNEVPHDFSYTTTESSQSMQERMPIDIRAHASSVFLSLSKRARGPLTTDRLTKCIHEAADICKIQLHADPKLLIESIFPTHEAITANDFQEYIAQAIEQSDVRATIVDLKIAEVQSKNNYSKGLVLWWISYGILNFSLFAWKFLHYQHRKTSFNLSGYAICVARGAAQVNLLNGFFLLWPMLTRPQYWLTKFLPDLAHALFLRHRVLFHIVYGVMFYLSGWLHVVGQLISIFYSIPQASYSTWFRSSLSSALDFRGKPKPAIGDFLATLTGWTGVVMLLCSLLALVFKYKWQKEKNIRWNQYAHVLDGIMFALTFVHGAHHWLEPAQALAYLAFPTALYLLCEVVPRIFCTTWGLVVKFTKVQDGSLVLHLPKSKRFEGTLPGSFLRLQVPVISTTEWHPFSITGEESECISVHIQPNGDWTRKLIEIVHPHLIVRLDGPVPAPAVDVAQYNVAVLIGAGIGITPYLAVLQRHLESAGKQRLYVHWQSNKQSLFTAHSTLLDLVATQTNIDMQLYLTGPFTTKNPKETELLKLVQKLHPGYTIDMICGSRQPLPTKLGRPQWQSIFQSIAYDQSNEVVGVFFCGPPKFQSNISSALHFVENEANLHQNRIQFDFYPEVF